MTFEDENQTLNDGTPRGLVGLFNQGNSCYMNAAIQALSNCPPLREYFRSYLPSIQASRDANGLPPVKKPVSDAFQELLTKIWSNQQVRGNAVGPTLFSYRIKDRCAQFRGFTQQDAQEFIRCFLDILHQELRHPASIRYGEAEVGNSLSSSCSSSQDELNLGENDHFETADSGLSSDAGESKPDRPKRISTSSPKPQSSPERARSPSESTTKSKKGDVQHSKSIITDVFDGELVSTVKCMTCHHLSNTRETFQDISLSIPSLEQITLLREGSAADLESSSSSSEAESTMEESNDSVDSSPSDSKKKQVLPTSTQFSYAFWLIFLAKSWLIDSWLNHIINAYRFMFSSNISLEDCLYAFFSADHLHGEDMYSCEKCSKLRNGVKQCRLTKLPEILCIHLKRFRHELLYNSKVGTRVTFPLYDLDMKPFVMHSVLEQSDPEEFSTEYDLVAFVSHRGAGAEFGHYVAFCRNDVDGNWYEFDDSFVSQVSEADVMNREAYVLFYQKKGTPSTEVFKERISQALNNMKEPSPSAFFISSEWLFRFRTFSDPGPISNADFLCEHQGLNPLANRSQAISIPGNLWNMLFERYGGGPPCDRLVPCQTCLKRVIEIYARKQMELNNFAKLEKSVRYMAHLPLNIVAYSWFEQWEAFVTQFDRNPPGPIRNEALVQRHRDGSTTLRRGINYKSLTRDQWTYLHSIYGGGPEVFKTFDRQPTQDEVKEIVKKCDEEREKAFAAAVEPIVEAPESDVEEEKPKSKKLKLQKDSKETEESNSEKTDVEIIDDKEIKDEVSMEAD